MFSGIGGFEVGLELTITGLDMSKYDKYRKFDKYFQGDDLPLDDTEMHERLYKFKKEYYGALDKQFEEKYAQYIEEIRKSKKDEILGADDSEIYETLKNYEDELNEYIDNLIENSEKKFKKLHKHELNEGKKG